MISIKKKLNKDLSYYLKNNTYKTYRVLIKYKSINDTIIRKIKSYKCTLLYILEHSKIICAHLNCSSIYRLIEYPEIVYITFDEYLFICGNTISYSNQASLINAPTFNYSGTGIGVAIIDTGIYPHRDLTEKSNKIKEFHDIINNLEYPYDDNGHGTAIAGIISGNGISSQGKNRGIATSSEIYCYKAFDKLGKGFASDILFCLEDILQKAPSKNIKIICLPFEELNFNTFIIDAFNDTFKKITSNNIIIVVPSGSTNYTYGSLCGIATIDHCITVSGIQIDNNSYCYSSAGPLKNKHKPNVTAVCNNIICLNSDQTYISQKNGLKLYPTKLKNSYKVFSGTSISCAYISGICSLLLEKEPTLNLSDILSLFNLYATKNDHNINCVGSGIIDLKKLFET